LAEGEIKIENLDSKPNEQAEVRENSIENENIEALRAENTDNDELGIDLSGIKDKFKGIFGKKKSSSEVSKPTKEDDELGIDVSKAKNFFKSNAKWLIPLLCILLVMSVSIFLRTMPLNMPVTDQWAEDTVMKFYEGNIVSQINAQYPNLPEANRESLVEDELTLYLKENSDQVNADINSLSLQYKEQYRNSDGTLYLLGIDPWHYLRQTEYITENGFPGTSINEDGEIIDDYRLAPIGNEVKWEFHSWFGAGLHKFLNFFNEVPLMFSFFLVGVIFSALTVIPAFFIGKKITGNYVGAFFTSLIISVSAFFVQRTTGESSDTDVYVVFFPLLITWLFLEAFEAKTIKGKLTWISLAGISTGIFSFAWTGWWYVFDFVLATIGIYLLYLLIINYKRILSFIKSKEFLHPIYLFVSYFLTSALVANLFISFSDFWQIIYGPLRFIFALKDVAVTSLWPNIYTTVAELNVAPMSQVISQLGGTLLFVLAILGVILTAVKKDKSGVNNVKMAIFLTIWFLASLYATTKGVRFILQATPVFSIALGAFLGIVWHYASTWVTKNLKLNKWISSVGMFLILFLLLVQPIQAGYAQAYGSVPSMNDAWYDTLTKIKTEAPEDIVITSWWDFGYWFRAIADRSVTFDGGTQRGYDAHWVGKSLLTNDEKVTVGILRMLNCGQNNAFEELNAVVDDTALSINIINDIIVEDKNKAIDILADYGLSSTEIATVMMYTHCDAPTSYYITSEDMVGKAGVWGHFGSWDFEKATMYQGASKLSQNEAIEYLTTNFDVTEEEADQLYYEIETTSADNWIASWPGYYSGLSNCGDINGDTLTCNVGTSQGTFSFDIDLLTMDVTLQNTGEDIIYPTSVVYPTEDSIEEKKFSGELAEISLVLVPNGEGYQAMVTDPAHAYSTFTKLFYFEGHGTTCFTQFDEVYQFTGGKISTWVVDYDCQQENLVYVSEEETTEEEPVEENLTETSETSGQIYAAHILISTDDKTEEEALELIEEIAENVTAENFAEYAELYSEGPSSVNGGDLGWFSKGVMVSEFEDVAFELEEGEISEPVQTQFGWHLILVEEKQEE